MGIRVRVCTIDNDEGELETRVPKLEGNADMLSTFHKGLFGERGLRGRGGLSRH